MTTRVLTSNGALVRVCSTRRKIDLPIKEYQYCVALSARHRPRHEETGAHLPSFFRASLLTHYTSKIQHTYVDQRSLHLRQGSDLPKAMPFNLKDLCEALSCAGRTVTGYLGKVLSWVDRTFTMDNLIQLVSLHLFFACQNTYFPVEGRSGENFLADKRRDRSRKALGRRVGESCIG